MRDWRRLNYVTARRPIEPVTRRNEAVTVRPCLKAVEERNRFFLSESAREARFFFAGSAVAPGKSALVSDPRV